MHVFIVTDDTYQQRPSLAFLSHEDAVTAAQCAYGLSACGAENHVLSIPPLFSDPPGLVTLADIDEEQYLVSAKVRSGGDSTTD